MPVIVEEPRDTPVYRMRHSLSHVMAEAVLRLWPKTKLGFGPPIDDGFYYDFIFPEPVGDGQLPAIEDQMRVIIAEEQEFHREDLPIDEAYARLRRMEEPHKLEYAQELVEKKGAPSLSFYTNGPFVDMCEGPHIQNTRELPPDGFKLHSVSSAYWRGDERRERMTRIYAYAYPTKAEVEARVQEVEEAKRRDHRKLGRELGLFVLSEEVGPGLPLWLPNGAVIRRELEKLAYEMEFRAGFRQVATPHITKGGLYVTSGHIPLYLPSMFPPMDLGAEEGENDGARTAAPPEGGPGGDYRDKYFLKPMNCPHHHMIYAAEPRSYRDLPLRLAEYGTVYRYERGGQLQGLTRVRGMGMNDAHMYVTREQLKDEFKAVMEMHRRYYELFEFRNYFLRLSLWDPEDPKRKGKYVDDPQAWEMTERAVQESLEELGLWYKVEKGEAAFYGPKVDFQFQTVLEREFTVSTNQLDFAVPPRFGLTYIDKDGKPQTPFVIHRAPLGTHERFIAFLIEHYGGAFPTWLAPVQVMMVPVADRFVSYAQEVSATLRAKLVRCEIDLRSGTMGKKVRDAVTAKVPLVLVVGEKEQTARSVSVRRYGVEGQQSFSLESFVELIEKEIRGRAHVKSW